MLGTPFTHDIIRKYVVAFGTLFNNVKLMRTGASGTMQDGQWISVPLSYAPKEKWVARLQMDPDIARQIAITLPRISYELVTANYAPDRKMNTMNRQVATSGSGDIMKYMFSPVPYDFQFGVYTYSRNASDAANIIEQILPFFTPEFTLSLKGLTDLNINTDVPIILNSVSREDSYDGDFESRRTVIWTLDFTMKGVLYGPIRESKIVKKAYVDFFIPPDQSAVHKGVFANDSYESSTFVYLQSNTASRVGGSYGGAKITILANPDDDGGTGNTRTIIAYDSNAQRATLNSAFTDGAGDTVLAANTWTYKVQYGTDRTVAITDEHAAAALTISRIYVQPGLTANGDPTSNWETDISEDVTTIEADDDFGIIQTHTFFPSNTSFAGTRRNLETGVDE